MSWEEEERKRIKTNKYEARVLKVNRRLEALSKLTGIPLHKVHTRREHYRLTWPGNPVYLRNEETGETIMENPMMDHFDYGTRCMIRRKLLKVSKPCDVIRELLASYNLKPLIDKKGAVCGSVMVEATTNGINQ